MNERLTIDRVLPSFGLRLSDFLIDRIGSGHIHQTYRLRGHTSYILQRVNKDVFKQPEIIASNWQLAGDYLKEKFPKEPFLRCIPSLTETQMVYDESSFPWRLFPFWENTITVDSVETPEEAYSAAAAFARLSACLDDIDVSKFKETIPRFHDLAWRYEQFETALGQATPERIRNAREWIEACKRSHPLVGKFSGLILSGTLRLRITHNDTKINNILFEKSSRQAVCVIDLDTLMPGYFLYDLGDMVRTFVSPVSEEEKDYSKIIFRSGIYDAVTAGYRSQMDSVLSIEERNAIPLAGKVMTYIMALRFLADYLGGDHYYHTDYEGQNLVRAGNQLSFLRKLEEAIPTQP